MEAVSKFKPGDRVRVIDVRGQVDVLTYGDIYTVYSVSRFGTVRLQEKPQNFCAWRFEPALRLTQPPESDTPALTGGSSPYYKLPKNAEELQDLIEYKKMNFSEGNIFKACYRLGDKAGTTRKYDLEKIIFFAQRELALENAK